MVLPERIGGLPSGPSGLGTSGCRIGPITPVLDVPEPPAPPAPPPTPEPVEVLETPPVQVPETPEASPVEVAAPAEPQPELRSDLQPELHADVRVAPEPSSPSEDGEDVESRRIKGLKFHPPLRDDRGLADRVNERLMEWAEKEVELYPDDELRAMFLAFDPGRSVVMCHPDSASFEHLVAAGMLYIGENAVDDYFCEPDLGGTPDGLGARLLVAQTAIDPLHTAKEQVPKWLAGIASHPALRCMRSAMNYFERIATPAQAHRYRHDICNLYLGYCAEAACIQTGRTPAVWEYLAHRQFNNFRPCLTITDAVGGYELPAGMFARPDVQRATGLASNASTIVNDLFSLRKEMAQERVHHSLPTVIADEEGCDIDEAFQKTIDIHNELMDDFESLSALLAPTDPVLARYLAGLSNWVAGNHEWHSGLVGTRYATSP
ncbi:terpene synthase family protein [Actinomadura oligospora]|uniref:terpene synthase family protein n=1 Tax=Actinomadura oligospora TaxID=111804 RepID=UPI0012FCCCE2|nr:2-methylisoborneol synthase [Actinomadura oligospora]